MRIIQEYRRLTEEIAVIESRVKSRERERAKLKWEGIPGDIKGIDYSGVKIQSNSYQPESLDIALIYIQLTEQLEEMRKELGELRQQRTEIEEVINQFSGIEKQVLMYRIQGLTLEEIAVKLSYSLAWITKVSARISKEYSESIV